MAVKTTIAAEVKVDGIEKSAQSVGSLKKQLREAQNEVTQLSEKFGLASEQAVDAAKRAGALKDAIAGAKALTDAYNPNAKFKSFGAAIQGVTAGFTAYQGALGLIGVESKQVEETLLRVQSAMALSQGLNGLLEFRGSFKILKSVAVDAFKSIKAAIGSTGIGLFVIAIGTVVAYWDEIKETVIGVSEEQKNLNKLTSENLKTQQDKLKSLNSQDNVLKLQGKSEKEILNLKIKQYDQVIATAKAQLITEEELAKARNAAAEQNNEILKNVVRVGAEASTAVLRVLAAPIDGIILAVNTVSQALGKGKLIENNLNGLITSLNKTVSEQVATMIFDPAKTREEGQKTIDEAKDTIAELKNDQAGLLIQLNETNKKGVAETKKDLTEYNNFLKELQKEIDERNLSAFDLDKLRLEQERQDRIEKAKGNTEALLLIDENYYQKKRELENKYNPILGTDAKDVASDITSNPEIVQASAIAGMKMQLEDSVTENLQTNATLRNHIASLSSEQQIELAEKTSGILMSISDLVGKQTAAGKVLAIASATIDTYQAANSALKANYGIFGPAAQIAKFVAVAATIATGIKNVKAIAAVKVPGATGGSVPSISGVSAPLTPQVQTTRLDQASINQIGNAAAPRAYVLEQDVTSNQERIKQLNRAARIN
jgi:hypothetical protein